MTGLYAPPEASTEADIKRVKLCYQDPSINMDCVNRKWAELLSRPHPPDESELSSAVLEGKTRSVIIAAQSTRICSYCAMLF